MNPITPFNMRSLMIVLACGISPVSMAFDSGSTNADGTLSPIVDTIVQLPDSGILNYSSITIPIGVTVGFAKNTTNTPITLLVSGDVSIQGTLDISGGDSTDVGAAGDGNVGDDGLAGIGGAGGFNGGNGGDIDAFGGAGLGPGGGEPGAILCSRLSNAGSGGAGGGYATLGNTTNNVCSPTPQAGNSYGNVNLLPIIGGSGGGGAHGGLVFMGSGGGGGGGAIIIASSGTIDISGNLIANGGKSGSSAGLSIGGTGGGGSGGAIRIIATTITGNGVISAKEGSTGAGIGNGSVHNQGGKGSVGRIRLEAETILRTSATTPSYSFSAPQPIFLASLPSLRILSVAGANAPASPTGSADIILAATTPNPVNVIFETSNIPLGNTITLTVIPTIGNRSSIISNAINGSLALGTASASIDLPLGPSVLTGQVSYTVSASLGNALSRFAKGEQVERIRVVAALQGESKTTLITVAGNEYTLPSKTVRFN